MAEIDAEFRIAYAAFLRSWVGKEFFARGRSEGGGESEEDFEDMVNQLINQEYSPIAQMLRSSHAKHGRYPDFEEICPPNMPIIGIVPGIK